MYDPCNHFDKWIKVQDLHFCQFPARQGELGRNKFAVVFSDDSAWLPEWDSLIQILKHGLRTEMFNLEWHKHGQPRRYFVKQIVGVLNDEGYDIREFRNRIYETEYLHEFYIDAVASDGNLTISDVVTVQGNNFAKAKDEARSIFENKIRERIKNSKRKNVPMKIVEMHRKTYKLVDSDHEVVDKEESVF